MIVDLALKWPKKAKKKSKTMIWAEFLKLTCRPKKIQKNPLASPLNPTTRPPNPLNRLARPNLSTDG